MIYAALYVSAGKLHNDQKTEDIMWIVAFNITLCHVSQHATRQTDDLDDTVLNYGLDATKLLDSRNSTDCSSECCIYLLLCQLCTCDTGFVGIFTLMILVLCESLKLVIYCSDIILLILIGVMVAVLCCTGQVVCREGMGYLV